MRRRIEAVISIIVMTFLALTLWDVLSALTFTDMFGQSSYNTYTLQALAWREGRLSLGRDYPWLELAVYQGDYYVSFPPVPTIPVWILTYVFGAATPDNLLIKLYALFAMYAVYFTLVRQKYSAASAALTAFSVCFCGSAMALSTQGAVWYQAQMTALMTMCLSILWLRSGHITWSLFAYALSVGCRPFNAVYGPLIMFIWWRGARDPSDPPALALKKTVSGLWKGIALGLCVAGGMAWYNVARFGNPFEFGTSYLPEFMRSAHGEFSLHHQMSNIRDFVFGLPIARGVDGAWTLKMFGFSVFLANPMLMWLLSAIIADAVARRMTAEKAFLCACFMAQLFLLLLHRTFGGLQFGARYAVDLIPYAVLYMTLTKRRRVSVGEWIAYPLGICLSVIGVALVHI
ncbi:MAG: hypothetical protein IJJ23_00910 [Clostridia bacterium]|nr:hypothetical protein [Clostridia bacterium]